MLTVEQLERQHELRGKLLAIGAGARDRDHLIREAVRAGVSVSEVARLVGLTRQHTHKIVSDTP